MIRVHSLSTLTMLLVLLVASQSALSQAKGSIPLEQAAKEDKVTLEVTGLGGSTGDTILITVQRRVAGTLRLTLTPGTVFKSISGNVQNMAGACIKGERVSEIAYRPSSEIVLTDNAKHSYIVEAYCLDFHKANPGSRDPFSIAPPDPRAAGSCRRASRPERASIRLNQTSEFRGHNT